MDYWNGPLNCLPLFCCCTKFLRQAEQTTPVFRIVRYLHFPRRVRSGPLACLRAPSPSVHVPPHRLFFSSSSQHPDSSSASCRVLAQVVYSAFPPISAWFCISWPGSLVFFLIRRLWPIQAEYLFISYRILFTTPYPQTLPRVSRPWENQLYMILSSAGFKASQRHLCFLRFQSIGST